MSGILLHRSGMNDAELLAFPCVCGNVIHKSGFHIRSAPAEAPETAAGCPFIKLLIFCNDLAEMKCQNLETKTGIINKNIQENY